jgi:hypothetical protein
MRTVMTPTTGVPGAGGGPPGGFPHALSTLMIVSAAVDLRMWGTRMGLSVKGK